MSLTMEKIFESFALGYVKEHLRTFIRCEYCGELIHHPYKKESVMHGSYTDLDCIHVEIAISHKCKK